MVWPSLAMASLKESKKVFLDSSTTAAEVLDALGHVQDRIDLAFTNGYSQLLAELVPAFVGLVNDRFPPSVRTLLQLASLQSLSRRGRGAKGRTLRPALIGPPRALPCLPASVVAWRMLRGTRPRVFRARMQGPLMQRGLARGAG